MEASNLRARLLEYTVATMFLLQIVQGEKYFPKCKDHVGAEGLMGTVNECMFRCPSEIKLVCGSDRVSYFNECFLCRTACIKPGLKKACDGDCPCSVEEAANLESTRTTTVKRKGQPDEVKEVKYQGKPPKEDSKDKKLTKKEPIKMKVPKDNTKNTKPSEKNTDSKKPNRNADRHSEL